LAQGPGYSCGAVAPSIHVPTVHVRAMAGYGAQSYGGKGGSWSQGSDSWSQGNSGGGWSGGSSDWNNSGGNNSSWNNNAGGNQGWKDQGQQQGYSGKGSSGKGDQGKGKGTSGGWDGGKSDGKGGKPGKDTAAKGGKDNGKGCKGGQKLTNLRIECAHGSMVASIVSGSFAANGENHGKSAFKKDQQVSGLDVILYFWDDRDGADLCGWYVAPEIGGNQVWAFIPSKEANPPQTGWQVPYGGPVDPSFKLTYLGGAQQQQPQQQQWGQQQSQQQQWGQQQSQQQQWGQQKEQPQQKEQWGQQQQQWGQQQQKPEQQSQQSWGNQQKWGEQKQEQWGQQKQDWNQQSGGGWQQQDYRSQQQAEQQRKREEWEAQKAKKEAEMQAKKEAMEAQRQALQAKKQEEIRKKEEAFKAKQAELKAKQEAEAKKLAERKAAISVRRVIQKVRVASAENFEALQAEMEECFNTEAENLGDMLETVTVEKDKAVEGAQTRIEAALEKKRKEEEAKAEAERKKKEAEEAAALLVEEFSNLIDSADAHSEKLKELVKPMEAEEDIKKLDKAGIDKVISDFEGAADEAHNILKVCASFVREKGPAMKETSVAEVKQNITKQTQRVTECKKVMEATIKSGQGMIGKAKSRSLAIGKTEKLENLFKQYDKDKDGILNQVESKLFCKNVCKFTPSTAVWSTMWSKLTEDQKGVAVEGLTALKMMVGIEREKVRDAARKADRVEKERVIKEMKDTVVKRAKEASSVMAKANKEMAEIEEQLREAFSRKEREKPVEDMLVFADTLDTLGLQGRSKLETVQKTLKDLTEGADKKHESDLRSFLKGELRPLENIGQRFGMRVERAEKIAENFRSMAVRKTSVQLKRTKKDALKVVKYNQRLRKQDPEEFFTAMDTKGDGVIDEEEWLEFFQYADAEIRELFLEETKAKEEAEAKAEDETPAEEGEGEAKEETEEEAKEAKEEEETKAKEEEVPVLESIDLSAEDLTSVFRDLAPDGELPKDDFLRLIRHTMKVVSSTVMTENMSMKIEGGKLTSVRRLEKDEVVEVLLGPMTDKASRVNRIKARAVKDDKEGWVTIAGNSGTTFLTDGGSTFKVSKQVDLTTDFELEENGSESGKEALKPGTVLEVLELPRKEEKTENMRMKVQVEGGGSVGWVTSTSKSGITFLQAL